MTSENWEWWVKIRKQKQIIVKTDGVVIAGCELTWKQHNMAEWSCSVLAKDSHGESHNTTHTPLGTFYNAMQLGGWTSKGRGLFCFLGEEELWIFLFPKKKKEL